MDYPFFSIVVPAHNEAAYIEVTLERLLALDYPKDRCEIIVVENGSTDNTHAKAEVFSSRDVRVLVSEKGVSRARNLGARAVSNHSQWVLFLDADILLDPEFLSHVAVFLKTKEKSKKPFVAGTAALLPFPSTLSMQIMYAVANATFYMTGATYAGALFIRSDYIEKVSFDELLHVGEDESIAKELRREGQIFFLWSTMVHSSTRRFQNGGAQKIPLWVGMWLFAMIAPYHARITTAIQRSFKYRAVR
jgi:glycosyltransferase involved in cell wall biosynthesis